MLFNSLEFMIFFPIVIFLYFLLPHKFRWVLLLIASYIFYMWWKAEYLILILISTIIDYIAGIMIGKEKNKKIRKLLLLVSLLCNLGLLFFFKYFNFFNSSVAALFESLGVPYRIPALDLLLPVGISFYTFQTLSYTINVYRGRQIPEKHLGKFALYVAFFPQLVAGPIERSNTFLPQLSKKFTFNYERVVSGLKLMAWGFFKKIVVADNLSRLVNQVYNNVDDYSGIYYIIAAYFFSFQIICDFSGYSDIAIGAARVMGYKLMVNFRRAHLAPSIGEFWRRWHISLTTWFSDYVFIPLNRSKILRKKRYINTLITFILSGLWHGANWTFMVWGVLNGLYLVIGNITREIRKKIINTIGLHKIPKILKVFQIMITFSLSSFAAIFFRAGSISDALYIITHLHTGLRTFFLELIKAPFYPGLSPVKDMIENLYIQVPEFALMILAITSFLTVNIIQEFTSITKLMSKQPGWLRWALYLSLILCILCFGYFNKVEFIYFQF